MLFLDPVRPSVSKELTKMGLELEHRGEETVPEAWPFKKELFTCRR